MKKRLTEEVTMKEYRAILEPNGTWRVVEETTMFAGLSEDEAAEIIQRYKVGQRRVEQTYEQIMEAACESANILLGIA